MRVPWSWLQEFVAMSLKPAMVAEYLTMAGCEVSAIESRGGEPVFVLGVTPNRPDWLSIRGVAREVAAVTGARLRDRPVTSPPGTGDVRRSLRVTIRDRARCPRYSARRLHGVRVGPSPKAIQDRLIAAGIHPTNNVVDATNYVMWELGQPLHAFDARDIRGGCIAIQCVGRTETFTTLDGVTRHLAPDDLCICDAERPIALAGIMGGANSEIRDDTADIVLESAYFTPEGIRRTSRRLGCHSESSRRFERGVDPRRVVTALHRVAEMILQWAGGTASQDWVDRYPRPIRPPRIVLTPRDVAETLGVSVPARTVARILRRLECRVRGTTRWTVEPPTDRPDLTRPIDLVEEVARCHGYHHIPATLPRCTVDAATEPPSTAVVDAIRGWLRAQGFTEGLHYAFSPATIAERFAAGVAAVRIANPLGQEPTVLHSTLAGGLIESVQTNVRSGIATGRLFAIRPVFLSGGAGEVLQRLQVAGILFGTRKSMTWTEQESTIDFYDVKGVVEGLLASVGASVSTAARIGTPGFLHPGESADCLVGGASVGRYGMIGPELLRTYDLSTPVGFFEIDGDWLIQQAAARTPRFTPIPRFPSVRRDLACIVDGDLPAERLGGLIREAGGAFLRTITIFDVYRGAQIGEGKKSLAFALDYQDPERTLTDEEVNGAHQRIIDAVKRAVGAEIRS